MRVAAIQGQVVDGLYGEKTKLRALNLLDTAARKNIDIACLPEVSIDEETISAKSKELGIYVVGSVVKKEKSYYSDESIVVTPKGEIAGIQRRLLLYWTFEPDLIKPGKEINVSETDLGNIGILKCWEIAHPEVATILALKGAEIIFNPANWMSNLLHLWHKMLFMRCYENHIPVVGVNTAKWEKTGIAYKGKELNIFYGGKSAVVLPENFETIEDATLEAWSNRVLFTDERMFMAKAGDEEEILYCDIDLESYKEYRSGRLDNRVPSIRFLKETELLKGGFGCT